MSFWTTYTLTLKNLQYTAVTPYFILTLFHFHCAQSWHYWWKP